MEEGLKRECVKRGKGSRQASVPEAPQKLAGGATTGVMHPAIFSAPAGAEDPRYQQRHFRSPAGAGPLYCVVPVAKATG